MRNTKNAEIIFANLSWVNELKFRIFQVTTAVVRNFYVAFYSIFGSFAIVNLNCLLIFNDGSRYGSVYSKYGSFNSSITGSLTWKDLSFFLAPWPLQILKGVYVTTGNPAFCLFLYLTGVHFRGELQHGGDVSQQKSSVDQSELEK